MMLLRTTRTHMSLCGRPSTRQGPQVNMRALLKGLERVRPRYHTLKLPFAARQMHAVSAPACSTLLRTPQSLYCPRPVSSPWSARAPSIVARYGFQDDLIASIISQRTISSLQKPKSYPIDSSSSSTQSSIDDSDTASSSSSTVDGLTIDEIQAHKKAAVQQAFLNGTLGFGFSAGGLVFPYYVGLVSSLVQQGVLERPAQLAGSSAGSLIAASFNAGLDMATVERSMIDFGEDCLKNGTRYRLGPLLKDFLQQYLPPNAHELCSGRTHVAVTRLLPYWRTQMVSEFHSRDDLIQALLTSCHIPWYFDGRWMTKFRGHFCVDGGVMAFIPTVPDAEYTVKVMCFPSSHLNLIKNSTRGSRRLKRVYDFVDIDITMDSFEHWPYDLQQILKWALVASAQETSSLLIEKGKRDATLWVEAMELAPLVQQKKQGAGATDKQQQQQQWGSSSSGGGGSESRVDLPSWAAREGTNAEQYPQAVPAAATDTNSNSNAPADSNAATSTTDDWSDHKSQQQRQQEAQRAHEMTQEAEQAAAENNKNNDKNNRIEDVAAAAGVDDGRVRHAADMADLAEQSRKKQKVGGAAATAAAVVRGVGEGVGNVAKGVRGDREQSDAADRS